MKKRIFAVILLLIVGILCGCGSSSEEVYSKIKVGEVFGQNIDGYQKKLPKNYCLDVDLGTKARLIFVPEDLADKPYFSEGVYNTPAVLEGRYIKGYYDDEKLVLCEETAANSYDYIVFYFKSKKQEHYKNENELKDLKSDKWFSLCNSVND